MVLWKEMRNVALQDDRLFLDVLVADNLCLDLVDHIPCDILGHVGSPFQMSGYVHHLQLA
jgi:hypothetical protein